VKSIKDKDGDPEKFALGDCSTQRNLSAAGRAQERAELNSFFGFTIVMDKNTLRRKWRRSFQRPSVFFKWILSLFLLGHFKRGHHHG
jgi:hypothetical protein